MTRISVSTSISIDTNMNKFREILLVHTRCGMYWIMRIRKGTMN